MYERYTHPEVHPRYERYTTLRGTPCYERYTTLRGTPDYTHTQGGIPTYTHREACTQGGTPTMVHREACTQERDTYHGTQGGIYTVRRLPRASLNVIPSQEAPESIS